MTTIVRKLDDRGLVERSPDDRDRRVGRRTARLTVRSAALDEAQLARLAGAVEALEELLQPEEGSG